MLSQVTPSDITIPENGGPQTISLTTSFPHCGILGNMYSCEFAVELKAKDNFQYGTYYLAKLK